MNREDPALRKNQRKPKDELGVYIEEPTAPEQAPPPRERNYILLALLRT